MLYNRNVVMQIADIQWRGARMRTRVYRNLLISPDVVVDGWNILSFDVFYLPYFLLALLFVIKGEWIHTFVGHVQLFLS